MNPPFNASCPPTLVPAPNKLKSTAVVPATCPFSKPVPALLYLIPVFTAYAPPNAIPPTLVTDAAPTPKELIAVAVPPIAAPKTKVPPIDTGLFLTFSWIAKSRPSRLFSDIY